MDKKTLLAGLLIGIPIGGELNAYVAYGVYLNQFGLPNDPLGIGLGIAGVVSFLSGLAVLARKGPRV